MQEFKPDDLNLRHGFVETCKYILECVRMEVYKCQLMHI